MENKSLFGLNERISGALCYALSFVSGAVYLVCEKDNKFVRFHALQSFLWFAMLTVLRWILKFIPFIGWAAVDIIGLISIATWLLLMFKAYSGKTFKLPVIGDVVYNQVNK